MSVNDSPFSFGLYQYTSTSDELSKLQIYFINIKLDVLSVEV